MHLRLLLPGLLLLATPLLAGTAPEPAIPTVESQPLLAQVRRVREALEAAGVPLPEATRAALDRASAETGTAAVARVQQALDPHCLAEVTIHDAGRVTVVPGRSAPRLVEQGWRVHLIKVINLAEATTTLRVDSPQARQVPNAPAAEVRQRWLDLEPLDGRPLYPTLSGLGLEYRALNLYARDAGSPRATLQFSVGQWKLPEGTTGKIRPALVKEWRFERDTQGWQAQNECTVKAEGGLLKVQSTGSDPYMAVPVSTPGGRMVVRLRARVERGSIGTVFWWTEDRPAPDGGRLQHFQLEEGNGGFRDYTVSFQVTGEMRGLRIDPGSTPGLVEFESIALWYEDAPGPRVELPVTFQVEPSVPVTFRVRDEHDRPATACFEIRDDLNRVYPSQAKRLAPDFFFQPQIYRANGEKVRLPAGTYHVRCSRGPESVPESRELVVRDRPVTFEYRVRRWIDPSRQGWWSGDHHIHAAGCAHYSNPTEGVLPRDMARHIMGEDLKVGANLTWGPCFDYQKTFFTGKTDRVSRYPYLLRYDIEVSGFGSHQSGHLCLLRLKEQMYPGGASKDHWPTLGLNTLRWAKRQGAVTGPAHSAIGLSGSVGRVEGPQAVDGPGGLPNYVVPRYDGIGAQEFVVDITHEVPGPNGKPVPAVDFISTMNTDRRAEMNMWYHTLNCGFRVKASGETDFPCVSGERVGLGRVYVKQRQRLSYDDWCEGIREGRSYVSDGYHHLMNFRAADVGNPRQWAAVGERGSEIHLSQPGTVRVVVDAAFRRFQGRTKEAAEVPVEVIVNGYPVARRMVLADGRTVPVAVEVPIRQSSWVAVRAFPAAHTNPIWVTVDRRPVRANRASAEWLLRGVDQCWSQKERTYAPAEREEARRAYDHARAVYRRILAEGARSASAP